MLEVYKSLFNLNYITKELEKLKLNLILVLDYKNNASKDLLDL
jgi:hypothetical protein